MASRPRWSRSGLQSLIFDKKVFSKQQAKAWAKKHGFRSSSVDETKSTFRLRQCPPDQYKKKRWATIEIRPGVKAAIAEPKPGAKCARGNPGLDRHLQYARIAEGRAVDEEKLGWLWHAVISWSIALQEADHAATEYFNRDDSEGMNRAYRLKNKARLKRAELLKKLGEEEYPKMLPRKNPGHGSDAILEGAARAIFVDNWASLEDEAGHSYPGQDLMDVAPETSEEAERAAKDLLKQIAKSNNVRTVWQLFRRAMNADGIVASEQSDEDARDFGHYLAMQSMGHGVSWFDDHADFPLKLPHVEYWPADIVSDWEEED